MGSILPASPERLVFVTNPVSANAERARNHEERLRRTGIDIARLDTEPLASQTARKIAATLRSGDWLIVAGGDGTANDIISALLLDSAVDEASRKAPVVFLACGQVNDIAGWFNGKNAYSHPEKILRQGRIEAITPLVCQITPPGAEAQTMLAIAYAGLGASAAAAARLEASRSERLRSTHAGLHAGAIVLSALQEAQLFTVARSTRSNIGPSEERYEELIANGPTMAGLLHLPHKVADRSASILRIRENNPITIGIFIGQSIVGHLVSDELLIDRSISYKLYSEVGLQCDGQVRHLSPGTELAVGFHPRPFYAVTTNPRLYAPQSASSVSTLDM